jgi:hypothetical protein
VAGAGETVLHNTKVLSSTFNSWKDAIETRLTGFLANFPSQASSWGRSRAQPAAVDRAVAGPAAVAGAAVADRFGGKEAGPVGEEPVDRALAEEAVDRALAEEPVDRALAEEPVDRALAEEAVDTSLAEGAAGRAPAEEAVDRTPVAGREEVAGTMSLPARPSSRPRQYHQSRAGS